MEKARAASGERPAAVWSDWKPNFLTAPSACQSWMHELRRGPLGMETAGT